MIVGAFVVGPPQQTADLIGYAREVLCVALAAGQSAQTGTPVDITPGSWQGITS